VRGIPEEVLTQQAVSKSNQDLDKSMAAGMDFTMGRAGRMLPTMPWNW
jgi:hypothetical protein